MTIDVPTATVEATGNGVATSFSFSAIVIAAADELQVTKVVIATGVETLLVEGTGATKYAVVVAAFPGTGSITYPEDEVTPLPSTEKLVMKRIVDLTQERELSTQGPYSPAVQEAALDHLTKISIQQQEEIDRSLKLPLGEDTLTDFELPPTVDAAAGDVLALNTSKTAIEYATPNSSTYLTAPGSSTDNAIVRFDGAGGRSFQNSGVTISDANVLQHAAQTRWVKGADLTSAATLVIGADGNYFDVAGATGPITGMTVAAGTLFILQFDGAPTITHGAGLVMPFAANQVAQAGDEVMFFATAANTVRAIAYKHATAAAARTSLGLVIGTDVAAFAATVSQAEAEAGTETALRRWTPERVKQAIDALGGIPVDVQTFTSSGTWTKPSGIYALIENWGAGAGGGARNAASGGGGGGGGGYAWRFMLLSDLGATETVAIGAAGVGGAAAGNNGTAGGNTTFGAHLTAYGGGYGSTAAGGGGGGAEGAGGNGGVANGGVGGDPLGGAAGVGAAGGNSEALGGGGGGAEGAFAGGRSIWGGAGGGGNANTNGGKSTYGGGGGAGGITGGGQVGGASLFGGAGGAPEVAGTEPGGGGGAGDNAAAAGNGAKGRCRVTTW